MQFAFDEHQLEFRAQVRALAQKLCPPDALRVSWASAPGWSTERWGALAELGVTGLTVPEAFGGLGLGLVDLVLVLEEIGRSGLPEPVLDTVAVGVPLLLALSGLAAETWRADWLGRVVDGDAAIGVAEPDRPGVVRAGVDVALVWRAGALVAIAPGQVVSKELTLVDRSQQLWELDVSDELAIVLAEGDEAAASAGRALDRGATAAAAVLVGVADRLLALATDYARDRSQFGRAIGSFQAVKHHLAGAAVRLEFARPLVYRAAWTLDAGHASASVDASMAKAAASDAASLAARVALQVHGAIGYTWEHDVHLWMKRAWALASSWGDAGWHRSRMLELRPR